MKVAKKKSFTKKSKKEIRMLRKAQLDFRSGLSKAANDDSALFQSIKEHDAFFRQMVDMLRMSHKYRRERQEARPKEKERKESGKVQNKRERRKQLKREKKRRKSSAVVNIAKSKKIKNTSSKKDSEQTRVNKDNVRVTNEKNDSVDNRRVNVVNVTSDNRKQKSDKRDKNNKFDKKNKVLLHTENNTLGNVNVTETVLNESDVNFQSKVQKKGVEPNKNAKKHTISSGKKDSAPESESKLTVKEEKNKQLLQQKRVTDENCKVMPSSSKRVKTNHVVDKKNERADELDHNSKLQFSRFDFGESKKGEQVGKDFKRMLEKLETKKRKLERLRQSNDVDATAMESSMQWRGAIEKAEGKKMRDDEELLRKAMKKKTLLKKRTEKQWKKRTADVTRKIEARQKKRQTNIKERKRAKTKKKISRAIKKGRILPEMKNMS